MSERAYEANGRKRRLPLFWQVFAPNAAVMIAAVITLTVSPATVSSPPALREIVVITAGLTVMLLLNLVLMRRALAPLEELARVMREVDPLAPGARVGLQGHSTEIMELTSVFNAMIRRLETERRDSGLRMLAAQEGERRRVARELHDEVNQSITALMLEIGRAADHAPPALADDLRRTREAARDLSADVQRIVRQLRPEALDDLGLTSAITALAEGFSARTGIPVKHALERDLPPLGLETELVVYRVAQEGLTNAARHADASAVRLSLAAGVDRLSMRLVDNGRGLNGAAPGSGIRGMRERAMLVGAELEITSTPGGGTELRLEVPLEGSSR
jgi:two-component system, NarL family, sensor histidine kinase UhpB